MQQEPLTPEEYAMLLQLGGDNRQLMSEIEQQKLMAEQLRTEAPQGRATGRVFTAPHPLEAIGGLAKNFASGYQQNKANMAQKQVGENTQMQNRKIMEALLRRGQPQQPPQQPGQMSNPYDMFRQGGMT